MTEQQGFLNRWSRLKQQTEQDLVEAQTELKTEVDLASSVEGQEDESVPALHQLTDEDMPALEELDQDSDYSGFLSEKVSETLRRKALRKLFHLPEFNIRDGLNEYDEDYSQFVPLGDTVTYQMKQWAERQKEAFKEALEDDEQSLSQQEPDQAQSEPDVESLSEIDSGEPDQEDDELGCCD